MRRMNMSEEMMQKLNPEDMAQVTGGVLRTVQTGIDGMNAAVRSGPAKSNKQIASLPNGTVIDTISDQLVYDPEAGRNFVEITFTDKKGNTQTGWIASSIVGLKR